MAETMVRTYKKEKAYREEAARLAGEGWRVITVTQEQRPPGCARGCLLGIFSLIFKPRPRWVVTYQRGE